MGSLGDYDVDPISQVLLDQRVFLEKGILPEPGALNQQTPFYVQSMLTILRAEGEAADSRRKDKARNPNDSKGAKTPS